MITTNYKTDKLLIGLYLCQGNTIEEIAKNLGLPCDQDEIHTIIIYLEDKKYIKNTITHDENTVTELTSKGSGKAHQLIELSH